MKKTGNTEQQVFEAASRLFHRQGYRSTSMQDIASAVGIRKSSIYHYITAKEDLLRAIMEKTMGLLIEGGERAAFSAAAPHEKLRRFVTSHVTLMCEHLPLFAVTLRDLTPANAGGFWKEAVALRDRYESYLRGILRAGIEAGVFRGVDVRMTCLAILGMMNWLVRWYRPGGPWTPAEIAAEWFNLIVRGLNVEEEEE